MSNEQKRKLAIFYCQNVPESDEQNRQKLEKVYGHSVRFYPIPCSGRLEILHLLKALEDFADVAFVITCPEGACRYFEGNRRAKKRVERARSIIESIGLEKERIGIIIGSKDNLKGLEEHSREIVKLASAIPPSPVHGKYGARRKA
jgi:F420-non-reducing hydrogenase iron-sulfur subunit